MGRRPFDIPELHLRNCERIAKEMGPGRARQRTRHGALVPGELGDHSVCLARVCADRSNQCVVGDVLQMTLVFEPWACRG